MIRKMQLMNDVLTYIHTITLICMIGTSILAGMYPCLPSFVWKVAYLLISIVFCINSKINMFTILSLNKKQIVWFIVLTIVLLAMDFIHLCMRFIYDDSNEIFKFPSFCVDMLSLLSIILCLVFNW